ncbi:hypothetical protein Ahy_B06g081641 [Arachis hypogaea]|uniref:Uncharacterized protein n=1 Tax=Arachis hypogaea TaxID=3818 RepID=A0A444YLL8_ARAHY|nr:hypothetical protein Ahy_B06g081641 [Arachis hypogaea]
MTFLHHHSAMDFLNRVRKIHLLRRIQPAVEKEKSQESPILVEELKELVEQVINTGVAPALIFAEDKSPPCQKVQPTVSFVDKFQTPVTTVKTYNDKSTNEWDTVFILNYEYLLEITRGHFGSLKGNTYVKNLNLALENHEGKFKQPKTNNSFDIQNYKDFIPYLDKKKCTSHPFVSFMISRMRVFVGRQPLMNKNDEIEAPYVNITGFNCAIYVIKWIEIIEPENIKKGKYEEVDHFRIEYASLILFDEINRLRDKAIQECEAIRLSKPFAIVEDTNFQTNTNMSKWNKTRKYKKEEHAEYTEIISQYTKIVSHYTGKTILCY